MTGQGGFVTLEGGEGAGKSTQVRLLAESLRARGLEVVETREPGGSPRAERIREALLSGAVAPLGAVAEAMLFAAARLDHVDAVIRPALERGAFVVCDRFIDSTRVYQGALEGVSPALLLGLERLTAGDAVPDLTLVLDLDAELGLARARARRGAGEADRFEREAAGYHGRLRQAFLALAAAEPGRCRVVDAAGAPAAVAEQVWRAMRDRFPRLGGVGPAP